MALLKCYECGNDVSDTAKACPKCGAVVKVPKAPSRTVSGRTSLIVIVGFIVFIAMVASSPKKEATPEEQAAKAARAAEEQKQNLRILAYTNAQELLKRAAKDPASLVFRNEKVTDDGRILCLEVNGKNAFGALSGFEQYVYVNGKISRSDKDLKATCWNNKIKLQSLVRQ